MGADIVSIPKSKLHFDLNAFEIFGNRPHSDTRTEIRGPKIHEIPEKKPPEGHPSAHLKLKNLLGLYRIQDHAGLTGFFEQMTGAIDVACARKIDPQMNRFHPGHA